MAAPSAAVQYMILSLVISIFINLVVLGVVFISGVGQRVIIRYKQRWMYKKGKHVNVIFIRNNHVSREYFIKKEKDGSFLFEDKRYTINPVTTFIHDGIPTQINVEGDTETLNIFRDDEKKARTMSTAEIEKIIMNNNVGELVAMLKRLFPIFIIMLVVMVIFCGLSIYFNWKIYDIIYQKDAIQTIINAGKNATTVMPR
jgi:hypothetical protein